MIHHKSLKELQSALVSRELSSIDITTHYLERIKRLDPTLNSLVTLTEDRALEQAALADKRIHAGQAHPLTGLPIIHKDIFCTQGIKTSCGSKMLDNFISPYNAFAVQQLENAGMVMLGKANMDEFAMGSSNETSFYGTVQNPWDTSRIPGGSSGGSAAAMAARLTPITSGTDTGGSIRQPASLCGITGLKPTYGRVSRYGMIAFASSLDQAGPMAATAEDCAMLLQTMAGHDPQDSTSSKEPVPDYESILSTSLEGKRVGLPKEYFADGLDPEIADAVHAVAKQLESLGATLHEVSLPSTSIAPAVYYVLAPAECSSNLSRFDGVRFGHRCENPKNLVDLYERSRSEGFGAEVKRRILTGTYVLSSGYYDAYYCKALAIKEHIRQECLNVFDSIDCLLTPTTPTTAFGIGEKVDDPIAMYLSDIYTVAVNLAGLPALSMPAGFDKQGLPIGAQLIAAPWREGTLLNMAHQYQQHTNWHKQLPALATQPE